MNSDKAILIGIGCSAVSTCSDLAARGFNILAFLEPRTPKPVPVTAAKTAAVALPKPPQAFSLPLPLEDTIILAMPFAMQEKECDPETCRKAARRSVQNSCSDIRVCLDKRIGPDTRRVILFFDAADPLAGAVPPLVGLLPEKRSVILVTWGPDGDDKAKRVAVFNQTLFEIDELARGDPAILSVLTRDSQELPLLLHLITRLDDAVLRPPGDSFRGAPRAFLAADLKSVRVWANSREPSVMNVREWHEELVTERIRVETLIYLTTMHFISGLLRKLVKGRPASGRARELLSALQLPAFAVQGSRPLDRVLSSIRLHVTPTQAGTDLNKYQRMLDGVVRRRLGELDQLQLGYSQEGRELLQGGKLSLMSKDKRQGVLEITDQYLCEQMVSGGFAAAEVFFSEMEAALRERGAGAPSPAIDGRLSALEKERNRLRQASQAAKSLFTASRVDEEELSSRSTKIVAEMLTLHQARVIMKSAGEFWQEWLSHVRARKKECEAVKASAEVILEALAAQGETLCQGREFALDESDFERLCEASGLTVSGFCGAVRVAHQLLRWGSSPQAFLDDLVQFARERLAGLASVPSPSSHRAGAQFLLSKALEKKVPPLYHKERLSRREQIDPLVFVLYGPGCEEDAREIIAHLESSPTRMELDETGLLAWACIVPGLPASAFVFDEVLTTEQRSRLDRRLGAKLKSPKAFEAYLKAAGAAAAGRRDAAAEAYTSAAEIATESMEEFAPFLRAVASASAVRDFKSLLHLEKNLADLEIEGHHEETFLLSQIGMLAAALRKIPELTTEAHRILYFQQAHTLAHEIQTRIEDTLIEPERSLLGETLRRIIMGLKIGLSRARARAEIAAELVTKRLACSGTTRIELKLTNMGAVPARDLKIHLTPSNAFRILGDQEAGVAELPVGADAMVGFDVKPLGPARVAVSWKLSFSDLTQKRGSAEAGGSLEFIPTRQGFRRISRNPFIAGPPVKTEEMFFGRMDVLQFVQDNIQGRYQDNILLIHGPRRTGKSSILYRLEKGSYLGGKIPVYFDLQGLGRTSTETLLGGLGRKIARAYKKRGIDIPVPDPEAFKTDPYAAFRAFVDDIEDEMDTDRQAVVLIDEFEVLESKADQKQVDRDIFPFLRSLLQHASGMAFLLAGTRRLDDMKSEYWSVFYGLVRDKAIGYLQQSEMRQLVTQPLKDELEFDDLSLEAIYRHTAGHPYYAQLICQTIVNEMNALAVRNDVTMDDVSRAAQSVISLGGGQLLHEWKSIESPSARAVLAAAAEIADNAAAWIERSDIVSRLKKENYQVEGRVFDEALEILRKREIVTTPSADGPVKLRLDLLRQWLRRERPLKSALSEAIP